MNGTYAAGTNSFNNGSEFLIQNFKRMYTRNGAFFIRLHWCLKREFSFLNKEQAPNWFVSFDASKPQTPGYLNCLTWQYTVQRGKRPYTSRGGSLKFFIWSITFSKPERNFHMGFRQATFYLAELFRQITSPFKIYILQQR